MDDELARKIALIKRLADDKEASELITKLQRENEELKRRVIYLEHFISETIRLFGYSKIELGKALAKSLKLLHLHCWARAEDLCRLSKPSFKSNRLNHESDKKLREEFSKKYPLPLVSLDYRLLTSELPNDIQRFYEATTGDRYKAMSKVDAIKHLRRKHGYLEKTSSFVAYLERYSDISKKDLPSRRSIENNED